MRRARRCHDRQRGERRRARRLRVEEQHEQPRARARHPRPRPTAMRGGAGSKNLFVPTRRRSTRSAAPSTSTCCTRKGAAGAFIRRSATSWSRGMDRAAKAAHAALRARLEPRRVRSLSFATASFRCGRKASPAGGRRSNPAQRRHRAASRWARDRSQHEFRPETRIACSYAPPTPRRAAGAGLGGGPPARRASSLRPGVRSLGHAEPALRSRLRLRDRLASLPRRTGPPSRPAARG